MTIHRTLFKRDSKGKIREWRMETEGDRFRTIAGLQDGKQVTSGWTVAVPKNVGRANVTTGEEQATAEVEAQYTKKLRVDYFEAGKSIEVPKFFEPMLAKNWVDRKSKIDYSKPVYIQPKLDGMRCYTPSNGMFSRTGSDIVSSPHILRALSEVHSKYPNLKLDGELYNHELCDDFNAIMSMVRKTVDITDEDFRISEELVQYHVYDNPTDVSLSFGARYAALEAIFAEIDADSPIKLVKTYRCFNESEVDAYHDEFLAAGYEGSIIRLDGPYDNKRSNSLIKRKEYEDAEFGIIRIEPGLGNWGGVAKRITFRNNDGTEAGGGIKGKREYLRQVLLEADQYVGKRATIRFNGRTPDGKPRFARAIALHKKERW